MVEDILEEKNYVKKSLHDLWENLPLLLICNMLFCLLCVPSMIFFMSDLFILALWLGCFTVVPTFSGLMYVSGRIANRKSVGVNDMIYGIRHFYSRSLILGSLTASLISFAIGTARFLQVTPDQTWLIIPLSIQFAALLFVVLLFAYIFSLMTMYDISIKKTFIFAFTLASIYKVPTIGLFSLLVLCALSIRWTKLGLILVCPIVWAIFACNTTVLLLQKQKSPHE